MDPAKAAERANASSLAPTVFGWCGAGTCVRPAGRGECLGCSFLLPDPACADRVATWTRLVEEECRRAEAAGLFAELRLAKKRLQALRDLARVMSITEMARRDAAGGAALATLAASALEVLEGETADGGDPLGEACDG
jgi:hypothetical protein